MHTIRVTRLKGETRHPIVTHPYVPVLKTLRLHAFTVVMLPTLSVVSCAVQSFDQFSLTCPAPHPHLAMSQIVFPLSFGINHVFHTPKKEIITTPVSSDKSNMAEQNAYQMCVFFNFGVHDLQNLSFAVWVFVSCQRSHVLFLSHLSSLFLFVYFCLGWWSEFACSFQMLCCHSRIHLPTTMHHTDS